ncbi:MAG: DUF6766 family protein [Candidatus Sumerlaeaceae bacterium]
MKKWLYENGLSVALLLCFAVLLLGQSIAGMFEYNNSERQHGRPAVNYAGYVRSGHFVEATFENWESEFLQMGVYIVLTRVFRQKGSVESRKLKDEEEEEKARERETEKRARKMGAVPWPVKKGGWVLKLYEHSLWLAFLALFLISFALHAAGGFAEYNSENEEHAQPAKSFGSYLISSRLWFESFQNWQSEFLAVFAIVVFTIFLRAKDSAQSKAVGAAHSETGD